MKLITAPVRKALENTPLYSKDGQGKDAKVLVKFFGGGRYTFLVTEAEPHDTEEFLFFGYCVSPLGSDCDEFGYVTMKDLRGVTFPPFGLGIERDRGVAPNKYTVRELLI